MLKEFQHGINCEKKPHGAGGFMHLPEYDGPYEVDGITYCGRCHVWIESPVPGLAFARNIQTLGLKWHTAKVLDPANPNSHDYAPHYERLFVGREIKRILEIGTGIPAMVHPDQVAACSLFMWAERFPEAQVCGLDIREDCLVSAPRIQCHQCDVRSLASLRLAAHAMGGKFDLIVDDCTHVPADQLRAFAVFNNTLAENGVYVIEDVLPGGEASRGLNKHYRAAHTVIELNVDKITDDRLIVIPPLKMKVNPSV